MKTTKKLISLVLATLMAMSLCVCAFAEGENWVAVKTSADEPEAGDYYLDFASAEDEFLNKWEQSMLYDLIEPNSAYRVGMEALKAMYADEWAQAKETFKNAPENTVYNLTDESFYSGWPMYEAEDILLTVLAGYNNDDDTTNDIDISELGINALGEAYITTNYSSELAQAAAYAEQKLASYYSADWYVDLSFSEYPYIKAEVDGEELEDYDAYDAFSTFKINTTWNKVKKDSDELSDGDYYIDNSSLRTVLEFQYHALEAGNTLPYIQTDSGFRPMTEEEYVSEQFSSIINNNTFYVAADSDELFRYRIDIVYDFSDLETSAGAPESITDTLYLPLAEKTWANTGLTTEECDSFIKVYTAPEEDPDDEADDADSDDASESSSTKGGTGKVTWWWKLIDLLNKCFFKVFTAVAGVILNLFK